MEKLCFEDENIEGKVNIAKERLNELEVRGEETCLQ